MSLSVALRQQLGSFTLDVDFGTLGRLTALFGPSGSGKTSIVNAIAGLTRPAEGRIALDGEVLLDTASRRFVRPHRRRIGYVFQDARLFPHLSVDQNLRYGRFFSRQQQQRQVRLDEIVELLGIGHLLRRTPGALSGGERQRVAIGRALASNPRLVLMDEPLASLDEARKAEILPFLERLRDVAGIPIVYVSHSIAEVARLASDIVVLEEGRVRAAGPADTILGHLDLPGEQGGRPDTISFLRLAVDRHEEQGLTRLSARGGSWLVPRLEAPPGTEVRLLVRARDVMIATEEPRGLSALNILPAQVSGIEASDGEVLVHLDCGGELIAARITRHSAERLELQAGKAVHAIIKAVSIERN